MTREVRLTTRLLAVLDSIENDGEIVAAVRQLRRILGPGGLAKLVGAGEPVELVHPDETVAAGLRALGFMLQFVQHLDPRVTESTHKLAHALVNGRPIDVSDLVLALAFLPHAIVPEETSAVERFDLSADLRHSMDTLNTLVRRR